MYHDRNLLQAKGNSLLSQVQPIDDNFYVYQCFLSLGLRDTYRRPRIAAIGRSEAADSDCPSACQEPTNSPS